MMKVAILCVAALATASAFTPAAFVPMKGSVAGFKPALRSAAPRVASPLSLQAKADFEISDGVKFELNPFVLAASFYGWVLPTVFIPSNIPLYGSKGIGLTQALYNEITEHLATFPTPPAISDPFWVILFIWHSGLFATMIFGTIGYNGYYLASKKK
jgi:photosystem I protein PsaO